MDKDQKSNKNGWYLYVIPFLGKKEFKFGIGKGSNKLKRVITHHSRNEINLKNSYLVKGSESAIRRLEMDLKVDYNTEKFVPSREELESKYPRFLSDGYSEIRRVSCLVEVLDHIRFKISRPSSKLSELERGINIPMLEKQVKKKVRSENDVIINYKSDFSDWKTIIVDHKRLLIRLLTDNESEIENLGDNYFNIHSSSSLDGTKKSIFYNEKYKGFLGTTQGWTGYEVYEENGATYYKHMFRYNSQCITNPYVREEINTIHSYMLRASEKNH